MKSDSYENSAKQVPDFIAKILKMMQDFPTFINFSQEGNELVISDRQNFIENVLKKYFRHSNWRSFIRQLNMYNFRKINRGIDKQIFVHPTFQRDNENNFHLIRRKINSKEEERDHEKILQKQVQIILEKGFQKFSSLYNFMIQIFHLKTQNEGVITHMRRQIDDLANKRKEKQTKPIMQQIKESFQMMDEASQKLTTSLQNFSKTIEQNSPFNPQKQFIYPMSSFYQIVQTKKNDETLQNTKSKEINIQIQQRKKNSYKALGISSNCSFTSITNLMN